MKSKVSLLLLVLFFGASCFSQNHMVVLQPGPLDGQDTYINSAPYFCGTPNGNCPDLISSAYTYDGEFGIGRSLIRFDLSDVPMDKQIISARLNLYYDPLNGHGMQIGNNSSYLIRISSPWNEQSVTWNTQPSYDTSLRVLLATSVTSNQNYVGIDVTDMVIAMHNQPEQNYGFALNMINTEPYASMIFASSDNANMRLRPSLEITYFCESPLVDFTFISNSKTYSFTNLTTLANSYVWDFGDGYFSTLMDPQHTYAANGIYQVTLTASNECEDLSKTVLLYVCDSLQSSFVVNNVEGQLVDFQNNSLGANEYLWDFGDGTFSLNQSGSHYYLQDGEYSVCLIVGNECAVDTSCIVVNIQASGLADELESQLLIEPNPSWDGFTVESSRAFPPCSLKICNEWGQVIFSRDLKSKWNEIHVPKLVAGIYFLVLNTDTFAISKKIVSIP